jgi:hypothetical protein
VTSESFTCPVCGRTSYNPNDVREQWCGACHGLTGEPPPLGMRWVRFRDGDPALRFGRLLEERWLEDGATYDVDDDVYVYDGAEFVKQPR